MADKVNIANGGQTGDKISSEGVDPYDLSSSEKLDTEAKVLAALETTNFNSSDMSISTEGSVISVTFSNGGSLDFVYNQSLNQIMVIGEGISVADIANMDMLENGLNTVLSGNVGLIKQSVSIPMKREEDLEITKDIFSSDAEVNQAYEETSTSKTATESTKKISTTFNNDDSSSTYKKDLTQSLKDIVDMTGTEPSTYNQTIKDTVNITSIGLVKAAFQNAGANVSSSNIEIKESETVSGEYIATNLLDGTKYIIKSNPGTGSEVGTFNTDIKVVFTADVSEETLKTIVELKDGVSALVDNSSDDNANQFEMPASTTANLQGDINNIAPFVDTIAENRTYTIISSDGTPLDTDDNYKSMLAAKYGSVLANQAVFEDLGNGVKTTVIDGVDITIQLSDTATENIKSLSITQLIDKDSPYAASDATPSTTMDAVINSFSGVISATVDSVTISGETTNVNKASLEDTIANSSNTTGSVEFKEAKTILETELATTASMADKVNIANGGQTGDKISSEGVDPLMIFFSSSEKLDTEAKSVGCFAGYYF